MAPFSNNPNAMLMHRAVRVPLILLNCSLSVADIQATQAFKKIQDDYLKNNNCK